MAQIPNKTTSFGRIKSCDMMYLISVLLVLITFWFYVKSLWHLDNYTIGFQIQNTLFFYFDSISKSMICVSLKRRTILKIHEWDEVLNRVAVI
jgi:hypothetical protein